MIGRRCSSLILAVFAALPVSSLKAQSGMVPYTMDHRRGALTPSPVDVSFLLDAPAGKHGFVKVEDGHLATGDGHRIRLWGVNITDWSAGSRQIPEKADAALWAGTLARFGVNSVRFQFLDLKQPRGLIKSGVAGTRVLDPEQFDREDFFIAELEKRGIYIDFNLLVGRPFEEADGVRDAALLREGAKGTSMYDARMIELEKEYARQLLTHLNPYTKLKYTDDPAVAIVEINNENAINVGFRAPSPFYTEELTALYNQWLSQQRSAAELAALRTVCKVAAAAPVPLLGGRGQAPQAPPVRFQAEADFYSQLQRNYFDDFKHFLKDTLQSKSLILGTADHNHAASGYPIVRANAGMDIIDGHTYWQHPEYYVRKLPMVNDPLHSTVVGLSRSAMAGKPYTVSEVNNPFPNDYAGEGIPVLAAYGSLQDWDGIFWYTFEPKARADWQPFVGDPFDVSLDPVKMPELAQGALMFLRADVRKAQSTSERMYSKQQVDDSMILPSTESPYFTDGFPLELPLEHEVRIASLDGAPTPAFAGGAGPGPILSDTSELAWYAPPAAKNGLVTIDTPRTQGIIGFAGTATKPLTHLSAQLTNSFCTILLTAMDAQPIATSSRLLLVAGGKVQNTGQTWNSAGTDLTAFGGPPTLVEQVKGTLLLRDIHAARSVNLQPMDGAGQPIGTPVEGKAENGGWALPIGATTATWYLVRVVR